MSPKATWIGPRTHIPDLGITVERGDTFDAPANLGGEGENWKRKPATKTTKSAKAKAEPAAGEKE